MASPSTNTARREKMKMHPVWGLILAAFGAPLLSLTVWGLVSSGRISARMDLHEQLPNHSNSVTQHEFDRRMASMESHLDSRLASLEQTLNAILLDLRNR